MTPDLNKRHSCKYCNGSLDLRYYFCVHCAMPYRSPDSGVYGEEPPLVPTLDEKLSKEGRSSLNLFFILAVGMVILSVLGTLIDGKDVWVTIALQELFILSVTLFYLLSHWREVSYLFKGMRICGALFASIPLLALLLGLNKLYHEFFTSLFNMENAETWLDRLKEDLPASLILLTICVFPAIFEEIAFRGVIQQRLVRIGGVKIGFALTSILFTALHFTVISSPYLFILSFFLCWVRDRTRSIYPPMLLHFIHNFAVLFFLDKL